MVLALVMLVVSALVSVAMILEVALVPVVLAATGEGAAMTGSGWRCGW